MIKLMICIPSSCQHTDSHLRILNVGTFINNQIAILREQAFITSAVIDEEYKVDNGNGQFKLYKITGPSSRHRSYSPLLRLVLQ